MFGRLREISTIGTFVLTCVVVCLACAVPFSIVQQCNHRNEVPTVKTYPNSELTGQSLSDFGVQHMATLRYVAGVSHQELLAYFSADLDCNVDNRGTSATCKGYLPDDAGEYFIYMKQDETTQGSETHYFVEISWKGCSWNFQMTE